MIYIEYCGLRKVNTIFSEFIEFLKIKGCSDSHWNFIDNLTFFQSVSNLNLFDFPVEISPTRKLAKYNATADENRIHEIDWRSSNG